MNKSPQNWRYNQPRASLRSYDFQVVSQPEMEFLKVERDQGWYDGLVVSCCLSASRTRVQCPVGPRVFLCGVSMFFPTLFYVFKVFGLDITNQRRVIYSVLFRWSQTKNAMLPICHNEWKVLNLQNKAVSYLSSLFMILKSQIRIIISLVMGSEH